MKKIILLVCFLCSCNLLAQIKGKVIDSKGKPLSAVSIYLKTTNKGTTSNEQGAYMLPLKQKGNYTVAFQFLGFKTVEKKINVQSFPVIINVKMEEEEVLLNEILLTFGENPANKIIRQVIKHKSKNTDKLAQFTARFYSRGLFKIKNAPKKILGQKVGDLGGGLDSTRSGIIYLSETVSKIWHQKKPKKFKEHIIASKVSGSNNGISFNRAEEANFNFYDNLIPLAEIDLISPIADYAFGYYKYKLEGSFYDKNKKLINKIKVIPKTLNSPTFSGFIYIVEDDWTVYGTNFKVTGKQANFPIIKTLHFRQNFTFLEHRNIWILATQTIDFNFGMFGFNVNGRFSAAYSEYNLSPKFTEETFSNQVLSFEKNATKKDSVYWTSLRSVPLTKEEVKDYIVKDSIKVVRKSKKYLDSVDAKQNKVSWLSPITGYTYRNSYKKWSINYNGLLDNLGFNTVQGWNSSLGIHYFKRLNDAGNWWSAGANVTYGLSEKKMRPTAHFSKRWNNISNPSLSILTGITTKQFNSSNPISKLENTVFSLLWKENYMKIYEQTFAKVSYSEEFFNGVRLSSSLQFADRKPLHNTTDFSFFAKNKMYTTNNPINPKRTTAHFKPHKIWAFSLGANIVFGQKYLMYPKNKVNIESNKYPSLFLGYRKTFGANNSQYNSDLFSARLRQKLKISNLGVFRYNASSGIFLKKKNIAFMDYVHPNGNQFKYYSSDRLDQFNLLKDYVLSTNDKYAEMHLEHNFKGFMLSKIPLINKLNLHLVGGAKTLFTGGNKPYTEYSIGLDNIGFGKWRFLRVDYVRSYFNNITNDGVLFRLSLF